MTSSTVRHADAATRRLLIALAAADGHYQPLAHDLDVCPFQRHQFGAAEATGEAQKQQRPVALVAQDLPQAVQNQQQIIAQRAWSVAGGAVLATQAALRGLCAFAAAGVRQARHLVRFRDRSETSLDCRHCMAPRVVPDVGPDRGRRCGQSPAPTLEMSQITSQGPLRRRREAVPQQVGRFVC